MNMNDLKSFAIQWKKQNKMQIFFILSFFKLIN